MQPLVYNKKNLNTTINAIQQLLQSELKSLDELILRELKSEVTLINEVTLHIVNSGGKRLRPLIVLLIAKALIYTGDNEHLELAAVIEFIHTATLLHDDVVDASTQRRNKPTANELFGNEASVLAGDFLYSRAFQLLAKRSNIPVMKVISNATNRISEGEVMQLMNIGKTDLTEKDYFTIIERKTAQLYSAASEIAAIIATHNNAQIINSAARFGIHLGLAFQLTDDLLDYTADHNLIGKNLGDDLNEGKVTLPLIYTLQRGSTVHKEIILKAIKSKNRESMKKVVEAITISKGSEYTFNYAKKEAERAKECLRTLPQNVYHDSLNELCDFVLHRKY